LNLQKKNRKKNFLEFVNLGRSKKSKKKVASENSPNGLNPKFREAKINNENRVKRNRAKIEAQIERISETRNRPKTAERSPKRNHQRKTRNKPVTNRPDQNENNL